MLKLNYSLPPGIACRNSAEFMSFLSRSTNHIADRVDIERSLIVHEADFSVNGFCAICNEWVPFHVDWLYSYYNHDGVRVPNWREHLICPICKLNNRMRAAVSFMRATAEKEWNIYLTEQTTPLYQAAARHFPNIKGSEFLRDGTARGKKNKNGLQHEDITSLSFHDRSFDLIGTFDVLEHVPDYKSALREFFRCLKPGGHVLISVPFSVDADSTITRALLLPDGSTKHIVQPEYHGDPLDVDGIILSYYTFGWSFLQDLTEAGFQDSSVFLYWSKDFGYLGENQLVILAKRPEQRLPSA